MASVPSQCLLSTLSFILYCNIQGMWLLNLMTSQSVALSAVKEWMLQRRRVIMKAEKRKENKEETDGGRGEEEKHNTLWSCVCLSLICTKLLQLLTIMVYLSHFPCCRYWIVASSWSVWVILVAHTVLTPFFNQECVPLQQQFIVTNCLSLQNVNIRMWVVGYPVPACKTIHLQLHYLLREQYQTKSYWLITDDHLVIDNYTGTLQKNWNNTQT